MPTDDVFELLGDEFEQVVHLHDAETDLLAIVALHSTVLGPGLGGTRFLPYATSHDALVDVLRLARGMTYKHAVSGLDFGGGKAVILGDPRQLRTDALIRSYARMLDQLGGRYLTAQDVGTTQADMDLIRQETPYVTGTSESLGGSGDPSPATAWGVLHAMRAAVEHLWQRDSLAGSSVVVSGLGKVGSALVGHLIDEGAEVVVADVDELAVKRVTTRYDIEVTEPERAHELQCDIWAPCALGGVVNEHNVGNLGAHVICGAANNQLTVPSDGPMLDANAILYVPDYVANAGGVINIAEEAGTAGYDRERAFARIAGIRDTVQRVLTLADELHVSTSEAADHLVAQRLAAGRAARDERADT